jgi:hypothetical protein
MDQIVASPHKIPKNPYERELSRLDPALFKAIPPALQPIWPLLKAIYRQTSRSPEPKTAPAPAPKPHESLLSVSEAAVILGVTGRHDPKMG